MAEAIFNIPPDLSLFQWLRWSAPRRLFVWIVGVPFIAAFSVFLATHLGAGSTTPNAGAPTITGAGLVFIAAILCEYIDSSLGMGYGTTLTALLMLFGFDPLTIVPCVLLSELLTGLAATLLHHRDGNVDLVRDRQIRATAIWLSCLSLVGAAGGLFLALHISKRTLAAFIGIVVVSVGLLTLATRRRQLRYRRLHIIGLGLVAAFNKALSGGGYGPLVTAGQVVSGVPGKSAVAITSLAESFTCFVGLVGYLVIKGGLHWPLAIPLTAGALCSVPLATLTVKLMKESTLRGIVGAVTCLLGILTLVTIS